MEFEIRVLKGNGTINSKQICLSKQLLSNINCKEVVIDRENLSFRASLLDDTKTYKITSIGRFYFNDTDDVLPDGRYKVEKVGDNYLIADKPMEITKEQKMVVGKLISKLGKERCDICNKLISLDDEYDKSLNIGPHHTRCLTKLKYKQ